MRSATQDPREVPTVASLLMIVVSPCVSKLAQMLLPRARGPTRENDSLWARRTLFEMLVRPTRRTYLFFLVPPSSEGHPPVPSFPASLAHGRDV